MSKQPGKYPDQLRERAVRMVLDHGHEYGSQWEAICSVSEKLATPDGGPKPETVRLWVRQDDDVCTGVASAGGSVGRAEQARRAVVVPGCSP